jgi:hypothetical protein
MQDEKTFIKEKSIQFFKKKNNLEFNDDEVEIHFSKLSGISNLIFNIKITSDKHKFDIDSIFFKVFGRISGTIYFKYKY